jgi:hypothetical protein
MIDAVAGSNVPELRQVNGGGYALYRLRQRVAQSGYGGMEAKLQKVMKQYSVSRPSQNDLNSWGYRLLGKKQNKPAIAVLELATQLYPDNGNAHDSLAEAYETDHATEPAIPPLPPRAGTEPTEPQRRRPAEVPAINSGVRSKIRRRALP